MKKYTPYLFRKFLLFILVLSNLFTWSQTSMFTEFAALPSFPPGAKEAFKAVKTSSASEYYSFQDYSTPTLAYQKKIEKDLEPFKQIILAKGAAGIAPGMGAANDFSDLNSPEMQAKIAKMTQEEKIKFAMEVQERMKNNKNIQTVTASTKPSPLMGIVLKLNSFSQKLLALLPDFSATPFPGYHQCDNLCPVVDDPTCATRTRVCENKAAHAFYTPEVKRYNDFIKNTTLQFNQNKAAFEKDLKEFDALASKYPKDELAADYMNVFSMLSSFLVKLQEYEKQGAGIIIETKNNAYCKTDY